MESDRCFFFLSEGSAGLAAARTATVESALLVSEPRLSRPDHALGSSPGVFGDLSSTEEPSCCIWVGGCVASDLLAGLGDASPG